jgi:WD40 repeat protein
MKWNERIRRWGRGLPLVALAVSLGPGVAFAQTPPPAQPAPPANLAAEPLTYGQDQIPDANQPDARIRNFYARTVAGGDESQLTTLGNVWYQNWAPDGSAIALVTEDLTLYVMKPDGGDLRRIAGGVYSNPFWSPDARFIAYLGGERWADKPLPRGDLWLVRADGGNAPIKIPGATGIPSLPAGVAWSPDGTRIAAGFPGHIFDLTAPDAAPAALPGDGAKLWVLGGGWSPDGKYLATSDGNRFGVLTLATGKFQSVVSVRGAVGAVKGGASWAAGPRRVVISVSSPGPDPHRVVSADLDGANPRPIWSVPYTYNPRKGEISSIGPPGVAPSGQQILIRVSRTTAKAGRLIFNHETWLLRLDGSDNKLFIPSSFNAVWKPKTRFTAASGAFYNVWRLADNAVATGQVARPWLWGSKPFASTLEPWAESPNGQRLVEYYDKGRMEIANPAGDRPDKYYVTSGLLAREMVTGQVQVGQAAFQAAAPAAVPVTGDGADNPAPTYATFATLGAGTDAGKAADRTGQPVSQTLALDGGLGEDAGLGAGVTDAHFVPESGHNVPDAFWGWMQKQPDWVSLLGYPISEPVWVRATIAGKPDQPVLVQIFERRTLSFNFQNAPEWRVELGNEGQQDYAWRYPGK